MELRVEDLRKSYGGAAVLQGVSFTAEIGLTRVTGSSGIGKTTLLRILGGFLQPSEGKVLFDGEDIVSVPPYKREINTVFQKYALFPHMDVYDNIAFGLTLKKEPKDVIEQKVMRMLRLVSLEDYAHRNVTELSGGQQQRIAIARALVNEPSVLLLDEPLGALDLKLRKEMQQELKYIQQEVGITFIFVTHDQEEAMTVSDRIFLMNRGAIVQQGTPEEVYLNPADEFAARFIGSYNLLTKAEAKVLLEFDSPEDLVAVRPESVFVREEGGKYPETCSEPVDGRVVSHQLLGNVIRYRIAAADTVLTVDVMNRSSSRLYAPESAVKLLFNLAELRPLAAQTQH